MVEKEAEREAKVEKVISFFLFFLNKIPFAFYVINY